MWTTRSATLLILVAVVAGISGEYLFRAAAGANVFIWMMIVTMGLLWTTRHEAILLQGEGRLLVLPILFLAAAYAWRNSPLLLFVDSLVLGFTIALAAMKTRKGHLRQEGVAAYFLGAVTGAANLLLAPVLLLFRDISWQNVLRRRWYQPAAAIARGLLLAIPLLLLFGTLLSSADVVFRQFIAHLFDFRLSAALEHVAIALGFSWLTAGTLHTVTRATEPNWADLEERLPSVFLGRVEIATVLGSLNLLFLSFVVIQARYLFGGGTFVDSTGGLTYAEYARSGFFELVAVALLVLPLLLLGQWLVREDDERGQSWFRGLATGQVALLFVIMASSFYRMRLYQLEFGQTELRFYVSAFMMWLAAIFAWFAATVLLKHRERFMFGAMIMGYVALLLLHTLNPDAIIARENLSHFAHTGRYDAYYNLCLSADAVPVLVEAVSDLPEEQASLMAECLLKRWSSTKPTDWREWNWGRWSARRAVEQNRELLKHTAAGAGGGT
jgi:hypothetical protein